MTAAGLPIDVLLVSSADGTQESWGERRRTVLEQLGHRCVLAGSSAAAAAAAPHADIALVLVNATDPLLAVAELWSNHTSLPVVLCGDNILEPVRAAAFEAGVAFVTSAEPLPQELDALLRLLCEQNRLGSPELVRALCRTMFGLSKVVATATDTSFLAAAVQEVSSLFAAPIVSIMLFDDDSGDAPLRLVAQVGLSPTVHLEPPRRGGVADHVMKSGMPRILLRRPEHNGIDGVAGREDITASMCVPIRAAGSAVRPRGVVNVARRRAYSVFTPRDLDVCVSIAGLIGEALTALEARELSANLQLRMQAVERLSTVGEIAAGICHEVANPIACVRSNIDTIIDYMTQLTPTLNAGDHGEEIEQILDDLPALLCETYEGLQRTEEVVRQMKALVRVNGVVARDESVALGAVVEDTVRLLRPRLRVPVALDIDRSVMLTGSSAELSQVIVNLVINAGDACEERRAREELAGRKHNAEVCVTVAREDGNAVVHVIDNGVGIAPEALKRIFLPLFTTKPSDRGTGLGLAIVRRVVEAHGGRVHVRSTPGTGTAFTVALPLHGLPGRDTAPIDGVTIT